MHKTFFINLNPIHSGQSKESIQKIKLRNFGHVSKIGSTLPTKYLSMDKNKFGQVLLLSTLPTYQKSLDIFELNLFYFQCYFLFHFQFRFQFYCSFSILFFLFSIFISSILFSMTFSILFSISFSILFLARATLFYKSVFCMSVS